MLTNNSLEVPGILIQHKVKHTFEMHLMAVGACRGEMKALERAGIEFKQKRKGD